MKIPFKNNLFFESISLRATKNILIFFALLIIINVVLFIANIFFAPNSLLVKAPYYKEIMKITAPLSYNGLERLKHKNVDLILDFDNQVWKLTNVHHFSHDGKIMLEGGRFGICGELSQYVYEKILPFMGEKYKVEFADVAESGFFLAPRASHTALIITNKYNPAEIYLLDPSFHRYGLIDDFDEYFFFGTADDIPGIKEKSADLVLKVDNAVPLIIQYKALFLLKVGKMNNKFDKDNFLIGLIINKQNKYSGRYVFYLCKDSGMLQSFENADLVRGILNDRQYKEFKKIFFKLAKRYFDIKDYHSIGVYTPKK